ncbi:murein biosynthesis integral membrane protein MurJ [Nocardiopsis sp. NPDC055879]
MSTDGDDGRDEPAHRSRATTPAQVTASPLVATEGGTGLVRSGALMAAGTLVSRATGFVRTVVLAAALGTQLLGDAYNTANTLSFIAYDLLIGGLMASVIVPFLVRCRKADRDGGLATEQRLFSAALLFLLIATALAVLAAKPIVGLYAGGFTPAQHEVAVLFGRYLLVQILFIGVSGLSSAMLNSRGRFAASAWAPVLNNLLIIGVGAAFLWIAGPGRTPESITQGQIALLGAGTAGGVVLQALVLQIALRRSGFRWRLRLDLRGSGLGEALRSAGWMFLLVCTMQTGFLITANLANRAGATAASEGSGVGAGLTAYNYAYQLFQLPYAIIAVSVITVLLPRMSAHAADHDWERVRDDFSRGLRGSSVVLVPLALALMVYAAPLCVAVFARGSTSIEDAQAIAGVLTVFAAGLIPFTAYQLLLRVFYATGDTRTPALLSLGNVAVHGTIAVISYLVLLPSQVVMGIAGGFMLSYVNGLVFGGIILSRRLGSVDASRIGATVARLYLTALPGAAVAWAIQVFWFDDPAWGLAATVAGPLVGCVVAGVLYLLLGYLFRIPEMRDLLGSVRTRAVSRRRSNSP